MKKTAMAVLIFAGMAGAQTVPSQSVVGFMAGSIDNLYTKLSTRQVVTAEDAGLAAAAVNLWFGYLSDIGYSPYESTFISQEVSGVMISQAQLQVLRNRAQLAGITMTQAQADNFVRLADGSFAQMQDTFARQGPGGLGAAIAVVLTKTVRGKTTATPVEAGIADQYAGMLAYHIAGGTLPGVSNLAGVPGWADAMTKLPFILAMLED